MAVGSSPLHGPEREEEEEDENLGRPGQQRVPHAKKAIKLYIPWWTCGRGGKTGWSPQRPEERDSGVVLGDTLHLLRMRPEATTDEDLAECASHDRRSSQNISVTEAAQRHALGRRAERRPVEGVASRLFGMVELAAAAWTQFGGAIFRADNHDRDFG